MFAITYYLEYDPHLEMYTDKATVYQGKIINTVPIPNTQKVLNQRQPRIYLQQPYRKNVLKSFPHDFNPIYEAEPDSYPNIPTVEEQMSEKYTRHYPPVFTPTTMFRSQDYKKKYLGGVRNNMHEVDGYSPFYENLCSCSNK